MGPKRQVFIAPWSQVIPNFSVEIKVFLILVQIGKYTQYKSRKRKYSIQIFKTPKNMPTLKN